MKIPKYLDIAIAAFVMFPLISLMWIDSLIEPERFWRCMNNRKHHPNCNKRFGYLTFFIELDKLPPPIGLRK